MRPWQPGPSAPGAAGGEHPGTGGNVYASALHDDRFHLNVFYRNGIYSPVAGWVTADSIAMLKPSEIANC